MGVVVVVLIWFIGACVAAGIMRVRAGLPFWSILPIHMFFTSFPWIIQTFPQMLFWPITLIVWLVRGRPACPWQATSTGRGNLKVVRVSPQVAAADAQ